MMKVLKRRLSAEQTEDNVNLSPNKTFLKKRSSAEQTEGDITPAGSNKKTRTMAERSIVVDTPNNKDASRSSRSVCSSMQCKQPSTPIFESLVVVSAQDEIVGTNNRTSCADGEREIKNDEEDEEHRAFLHHPPSSSPAMYTKEQVSSSGMVTGVSNSVKGTNSKIGSCSSFHIEAGMAFNTSTSVWSKNLSKITLQTSSSAQHHYQEESYQKNAGINRDEAAFLDPFEEDLEPVPLGPSGVVLGSSALFAVPPRCPSIHLSFGLWLSSHSEPRRGI